MEKRDLLVSLVVALLLIASACGSATPRPTPTPECTPEDVQAFLDELEPLLGRWDDRAKIAGSTARINLSPVLTDLQDTKQEVEDLEAPWCAESTQDRAVAYMEGIIDAYIAFMSDEPDYEVSDKFEAAEEMLTRFKTVRSNLKQEYLSE